MGKGAGLPWGHMGLKPNNFNWQITLITVKNKFKTCHYVTTGSSAITERPRNALCQFKYCQLLHNCTKQQLSSC